jgi:hypothetical protein
MSSLTSFKNALQALNTLVVKAEAARDSDAAAFEALRAASVAPRQLLSETHATLVAELRASDPEPTLPHATWFAQVQSRAEALFGPEPGRN